MKKENSHVEYQVLAQTGGYCMVDYFKLIDGTTLGVTDEEVVLSTKDWDQEDDGEYIGHTSISQYPRGLRDTTIKYPAPTAHNRLIEEGKELTGWYIKSHDVNTDDGIVFYDAITLRNGVYLTIDDAQITIFEDATEAYLIDIIER